MNSILKHIQKTNIFTFDNNWFFWKKLYNSCLKIEKLKRIFAKY